MKRWALPLLAVIAGCSSRGKDQPPAPVPPPVVETKPALPQVKLTRAATESSALVLAQLDGSSHAFIADEDDKAIVEVDLDRKTILHVTRLPDRPRDLLVLADGRLAATLPDASAVAVFTRDAAATLTEAQRLETPADPLAMATDKAETLYVTTGASHTLVSFSAKLEEQKRIKLGREPRAVLAADDHVFVTHAIEEYVSIVAGDGTIETTDISNRATCSGEGHCASARTARNAQSIVRFGENGIIIPAAQTMSVPSAAFSKRAFCPKPQPPRLDGKRSEPKLVPTGETDNGGYGFGDGENGPPVTADLAVLEAKTGKKWSAGMPPNMGAGCILPRAAIATKSDVVVACLGSARVVRYSVVAQQAWEEYRGHFEFDPKGKRPWGSFANGVEANVHAAKIDVPAGPTALALAPGEKGDAYVWSLFARKLTRVGATTAEEVVELPRAVAQDESWLTGRALFYTTDDARISKDGRACASCHVDGADDGLAWKTPEGLRRTRLLRGEVGSGPYGWTGEHATMPEHVSVTIKNLKGKGLPDADIANVVTFVTQMKRPTLKPTNAAARGKDVFASAECSHCHTAGGTDRQLHDVGTGGNFITPTLASISVRNVMLHDGRYKTLDELLLHTPNMGRIADLPPDDRKALASYLETL